MNILTGRAESSSIGALWITVGFPLQVGMLMWHKTIEASSLCPIANTELRVLIEWLTFVNPSSFLNGRSMVI